MPNGQTARRHCEEWRCAIVVSPGAREVAVQGLGHPVRHLERDCASQNRPFSALQRQLRGTGSASTRAAPRRKLIHVP